MGAEGHCCGEGWWWMMAKVNDCGFADGLWEGWKGLVSIQT